MSISAVSSTMIWPTNPAKTAEKPVFSTHVFAADSATIASSSAEAATATTGQNLPAGMSTSTRAALLALQEVGTRTASMNATPRHDFSNMTRGEIAAAGKDLFAEGKITLDELFRFDHPDGRMNIAADGQSAALDQNERLDFVAATRKAVRDMEDTGESRQAKSPYAMMVGLLGKLTQGQLT